MGTSYWLNEQDKLAIDNLIFLEEVETGVKYNRSQMVSRLIHHYERTKHLEYSRLSDLDKTERTP